LPTGRDVLAYIRELWDNEITPGVRESAQVQRMKKFMNFIGEGIGEKFLHDIRRVTTRRISGACAKIFESRPADDAGAGA
jgi:tRNA-dihydrouridine synthase B